MSTSPDRGRLAEARFLVVGAGGIGAPAAIALASAGARRLVLADDDVVETTNLHRQILFGERDVGRAKLDAARDALLARAPALEVTLHRGRALPDTALELARLADVVIDATDNFATRFLLADACALAGVPVVHAAAVRWTATVMASLPRGRPCYRCLFEDLPDGPAPDCATAGVVGPVCGVSGAVAAEMAISLALGERRLAGKVATYDGKKDELRLLAVAARAGCPLCGDRRSIHTLDEARYVGPACAS